MSIDVAIINLRKAMRDKRDKDIVKFKYTEYQKAYNNLEDRDILDKQTYRDISNDYYRYINSSEESRGK